MPLPATYCYRTPPSIAAYCHLPQVFFFFKGNIQIRIENELLDNSDSEFEKLLNFDKSFYEGEEEEGYAPLDFFYVLLLF